MQRWTLVITLFFTFISGCSYKNPNTENIDELEGLSKRTVKKEFDGISSIRIQALQDTAMTIGAQSGLYVRSKQLDAMLEKQDRYLRHVFNFNAMLLAHNVLPPVLSEGRGDAALNDETTIRIADRTYKIIAQARFVTTAPHWRDYLWLAYTQPPVPDVTLLPQNSKERELWRQYIDEGWQEGAKQCDAIFKENLARLKRDYTGMALYRKLLSQNMVSPPYVAKTSLGVTGGPSEMRINDQVLRISSLPHLDTNVHEWRPAVSHD